MKNAPVQAASGFSYSRAQFEDLVDAALAHARQLGATDAGAEASEGCGLSVSVRKGELENVERNRDKSLGVSVYLGQRRGNASTSDFSRAAIERTVQAAYDIARFTAEDPWPACRMRPTWRRRLRARDLDLFHPWAVTSEQAAEHGPALRAGGLCHRPPHHQQRRRRRVGAAEPLLQRAHARLSWRLCQLAPLDLGGADRRPGAGMQRDAWYSSMRDASELAVARGRGPLRGRARAVAPEVPQDQPRASARCCSSRRWPPACWARSCRRSAAARCTARAQLPAGFAGQARVRPHIDI
jgi:PmbA protein